MCLPKNEKRKKRDGKYERKPREPLLLLICYALPSVHLCLGAFPRCWLWQTKNLINPLSKCEEKVQSECCRCRRRCRCCCTVALTRTPTNAQECVCAYVCGRETLLLGVCVCVYKLLGDTVKESLLGALMSLTLFPTNKRQSWARERERARARD